MKALKYLAVAAVITLGFTACEKTDEMASVPFVPIDNGYGDAHNDGLDLIFSSLNVSKNIKKSDFQRNSEDLIQRAIDVTNKDILNKAGETVYQQAKNTITKDLYASTTIDQLQSQMSLKEKALLDEALAAVSSIDSQTSLDELKSKIVKDGNLSNTEKQQFYDMVDVIESSYEYWVDSDLPPIDAIPDGLSTTMVTQVVAADCIWFWQAGLASGLNPVITVGVSAIGSFIAWGQSR